MRKKPWQFDQPICSQVGVELFYIDDRDDVRPKVAVLADYNIARKICDSCVHKIDCAEWGIEHEVHGLWGGLTPQERAKIRKSRGIVVNTSVVSI